jgi:DNA-binding SARP family transcriptional activator/tetratricopeptide (TPR) repeat protein
MSDFTSDLTGCERLVCCVRFHILGPLEVWDGGRPVAVGGPQQRAVLALLLVYANQVVSADRLADHLWGEHAPPTARSLVQGCIAGLRRALRSGGDQWLLTRPPGYVLRIPPGALDLDGFEELIDAADEASGEGSTSALEKASALLREALSLWRGPALDGITLEACRAEASRLEERRLTVLERRIDIDLRLGLHWGLVGELQNLVRDHPLRERLWAQLMTALHRADRRADALDAYRTVRRALVDGLGVEPGATLQQLHRAILSGAEPPPAYRRPEPVPVPEPVVAPVGWAVPAQLPATVSAFTGRERHLKRLDELLSADHSGQARAVAIGVICGTAGVGKTALAVQWAHRTAEQFGDGQLYVNLRGYATTPALRPIEALAGFLQALGVPAEQVPAEPEQAAAMYRTVLAGRKMLVVLDNAQSAEQVRPLLPGGAGCVVLITSRDKLGGLVAREGAEHLTLDVLAADEADTLLARVRGRDRVAAEPAAVATLARLCAFLPLALRIAAANLTLHPKRTVAEHVTELGTGSRLRALAVDTDDHSAVRAAFDLSYGYLAPAARRLFRLLGLAPGSDFTADAAAAMGDTDPPSADLLLGRLSDAHLIDEHSTGRYTFHDLLRLYAAERAHEEDPGDERDTAVRRLYDWYLRRADGAADVLYPHMLRLPRATADRAVGDPLSTQDVGHAAALAWLEAERHNLVIAVGFAAEHGPRRAGWLLADALRGYFHLSRYTSDWLAVANAALTAARRDGDVPGQAAATHSLGTALRSIGEHDEALSEYADALRLTRACGWAESEATTLGNLGIVCRRLGRLAAAAGHLDAALVIDRRIGRRAGEANNLGNLATVYREMGRLHDAAECYEAAMVLNTSIGSRHGEALVLTGLGQVFHELGRIDEATRHLNEALHRYVEVGDRDGQAVIHYCLAMVDFDLDRPRQGRDLAAAALALARDTGDRETEAMALNALGCADCLLGDHRQAIAQHRLSYDLAHRTASRRLEGDALIGLATAHLHLGQHDDASGFAHRALALARRVGLQVVEGRAHTTFAEIYLAADQIEQAVEQAHLALVVHRRSGHRPGETRTLLLLDTALGRDGGATTAPCGTDTD